MRLGIQYILSLVMTLLLANCASAKNVTLEDVGLKKLSDGTVNISQDISLSGNTLVLPAGVTLKFEAGKTISDGTITGLGTQLSYTSTPLFSDIEIKGTWNVAELTTCFFAKTDRNTLSNLSAMLSDTIHNTVRIDNNCEVPIDIAWSSRFIIKSNTDVIFNGDIKAIYSEQPGGYAMYLNGSNINIIGNGHSLQGTIKESRKRNTIMQFLHGVMVSENCRNVTIDSLTSSYFCGDGFYTQGSEVKMTNLTARGNGRQGLSICGGDNVTIKNSTFTDTGKYGINQSKGPGAGIDIEPSDNMPVNNILIENCTMKNNYRYMEGYVNDLEIYDTHSGSITVRNCSFAGLYLGTCSNITIEGCRNVRTIYGVNSDVSRITIRNSGRPRVSQKLSRIL